MAIPNCSIYSTSLEDVPFSVSAPTGVNPTAVNPQMAFLAVPPPTQPAGTAYVTGSWQSTSGPPWVALCLIGSGGTISLSAGQWYAWIKLSESPEAPVKFAGILQVS